MDGTKRAYVARKTPFPKAGTSQYKALQDQTMKYLVQQSELDAIAMSLLEVIAADLVELDEIGRAIVEPSGEPLVQLGARCLRQRVVRSVADQQMAEAERGRYNKYITPRRGNRSGGAIHAGGEVSSRQ